MPVRLVQRWGSATKEWKTRRKWKGGWNARRRWFDPPAWRQFPRAGGTSSPTGPFPGNRPTGRFDFGLPAFTPPLPKAEHSRVARPPWSGQLHGERSGGKGPELGGDLTKLLVRPPGTRTTLGQGHLCGGGEHRDVPASTRHCPQALTSLPERVHKREGGPGISHRPTRTPVLRRQVAHLKLPVHRRSASTGKAWVRGCIFPTATPD